MKKYETKIDFLAKHQKFIDEIARIWLAEWIREKDDVGFEKLKKGIQKKLNINKVPFILVALDGGDWVGTASLWEHDLDKRPDLTPWIAGVYVKENYRGQGIASQLINRVLDIAKKFGFKKIYLHTEHTHRLYEKLGWSRLEESINDQGEPTTVYVLEI